MLARPTASIQGPPQWMRQRPTTNAAANTATMAPAHDGGPDKARRHGPPRPDPSWRVSPVDEVVVVVGEVGADLHKQRKHEAEAGR